MELQWYDIRELTEDAALAVMGMMDETSPSGSAPPVSFAAKNEIRIIDVYTQNCMTGLLRARIFSAFKKSARTESDAAENFCVS